VNGTTSSLTLEMLRNAGSADQEKAQQPVVDTSALGEFALDHVTPLFQTRKLAWSTSVLITACSDRSASSLATRGAETAISRIVTCVLSALLSAAP